MGKIYGGRWETVSDLGHGGQSFVFRAIDRSGQLPGEYALKWVKSPKRHLRFRSEVEAIKTLSHPNVIRLIDHSALDGPEPHDTARQYLVMPIATAGDLSQRSRLSLYPQSLDAILVVAEQLASALSAAHDAQIVHRDVKPQNVLFTGNGHEVWLADFGICLLRTFERATDTGEVVGPRAFMAPELEDGGQLEVSDAADVYSLGKVIFYMLSGGGVLARERLDDARWNGTFAASERHRLLKILLRRMICALPDRISSMAEVSLEIARLKTWEELARQLPVSSSTLAAFDRLRDAGDRKIQTIKTNADARMQERRNLEIVVGTIEAWLDRTLGAIAAISATAMELIATIPTLTDKDRPYISAGRDGSINIISARDIVLRVGGERHGREHVLRFLLGVHGRMKFVSGDAVAPEPAQDKTLSLIPQYLQRSQDGSRITPGFIGFLTPEKRLDPTPSIGRGPAGRQALRQSQARVTKEFLHGFSLSKEFKISEFPAVEAGLGECMDEALRLLITYVESGADVIG